MKAVLFTGVECPKCPAARKALREAAKELGWVEGRDFVEKLIDGDKLELGKAVEFDGEKMHVVGSESEINEGNVPAVLAGGDFAIEALMHQIASTPSLVLNEGMVFRGSVPEKDELVKEIKRVSE